MVSLSTNAATSVKQQKVTPTQQVSDTVNKKRNHASSNIVWLDSTITSSALDEDNDNYTQDISFTFDFDTSYASLPVYIELLLIDENDNVTRLTTSDVFTLTSDSVGDKQRFDVTVDEHLTSGFYRFGIDIYDAHNDQRISTVDYHTNTTLQAIKLEGHAFDHHDTFSLFSHHETLSIDNDHDGYFQRIVIVLDIDSIYASHQLNVRFMLDGRELFQSRSFTINGTSTNDKQSFDLLIPSAFATGSYQLSVTINELEQSNASHHSITHDLDIVPVESSYNDETLHSDVIVHEGGSFSLFTLIVLGIIYVKRRNPHKL